MQGRCPGGCGFVGSVRAVTSHMGGCSQYAQRFAEGADLRTPEDEFRAHAVDRKPAAAPRAPRVSAPEVSVEPATVSSPQPKRTATRRSAPMAAVPERVPGPVYVEYWQVPQSL
jgi:hypothetical protein